MFVLPTILPSNSEAETKETTSYKLGPKFELNWVSLRRQETVSV